MIVKTLEHCVCGNSSFSVSVGRGHELRKSRPMPDRKISAFSGDTVIPSGWNPISSLLLISVLLKRIFGCVTDTGTQCHSISHTSIMRSAKIGFELDMYRYEPRTCISRKITHIWKVSNRYGASESTSALPASLFHRQTLQACGPAGCFELV